MKFSIMKFLTKNLFQHFVFLKSLFFPFYCNKQKIKASNLETNTKTEFNEKKYFIH
jgi:hypothetical protein